MQVVNPKAPSFFIVQRHYLFIILTYTLMYLLMLNMTANISKKLKYRREALWAAWMGLSVMQELWSPPYYDYK